MLTREAFLSLPVVEIGGAANAERSVSILMHEGYDKPMGNASDLALKFLQKRTGVYLAQGDLVSPYAAWPVYARVNVHHIDFKGEE